MPELLTPEEARSAFHAGAKLLLATALRT